ncbi:hypothetical protein ACFWEJ_24965 [Promicromonospora sp. NPDC060204]
MNFMRTKIAKAVVLTSLGLAMSLGVGVQSLAADTGIVTFTGPILDY